MITTRWAVTTGPTAEPITLTEIKDHLGIDDTDSDARLDLLLMSARIHVERQTSRSLLTQTITAYFETWPGSKFTLPRASPLQSVTSVKYIDEDGVLQTVSTSIYDVYTTQEPGEIRLAYGQTWPTHRSETDAITIEYVAGWSDRQSVPADLRTAIMWLVGHWNENREATTTMNLAPVPFQLQGLINSYRVHWMHP